jgi:putative flippase GtrA
MRKARSLRQEVPISVLVGLLASVADWFTLVLCVHVGVPQRYAIVPAFCVGTAVQFVGNRRYAFGWRGVQDRALVHRQVLLFLLTESVALVLNAVVYNLLRESGRVDYRLSRPIASLLVYAGFSYPLWRRVFAPRAPAGVRADAGKEIG